MNKEFPILYKRAKTGKIQEWKIKVRDPLYSELDFPHIITSQGQLDGKKQEYIEVVKEGKQKRSVVEQAISEAQSKYNKKKDEGYKAIDELGIDFGGWNKDNLPIDLLIDILNKSLPDSNTDANGNVKPMLAQSWKKGKCKYPKYAQPKFNGVRCIAILEREFDKEPKITLLSRSGKPYSVFHIESDLSALSKKIDSGKIAILDGELYCHGMDLNRIVAAVKKSNEDTSKLEYHIYDIIYDNISQSVRDMDRIRLLNNSISNLRLVYNTEVNNDEEVKELHDKLVDGGYEGLILRDPNGKYEKGVRSKYLLKVKEFLDDEFEITGGELGSRGIEDMVFNLITKEGKEFKAKPKGDRDQKQSYWLDLANLIGKKATVRYFNITEFGIPFHAHVVVIRDYE